MDTILDAGLDATLDAGLGATLDAGFASGFAGVEDFFAAGAAVFEGLAAAFDVVGVDFDAGLFFAGVAAAGFARTCVTGARCTGSVTSRTRRGWIALDVRWFQRLRFSTDMLKRSAIVTSVSPARVV